MKQTFGIIGAGNIAKTLAAHLAKAGYPVLISSRKDPATLKDTATALGPDVTAVTPAAAAAADIVILAMPWTAAPSLKGLIDWKDRIVIDTTNHFKPDFSLYDIGDRASSEVVLDHIPGARLVKAFNTLYFKVLELNPQEGDTKRVIFTSGNHPETNKQVGELIQTLGFSVIDLGPLAIGGKLQQAKGPLASLNLLQKPNK